MPTYEGRTNKSWILWLVLLLLVLAAAGYLLFKNRHSLMATATATPSATVSASASASASASPSVAPLSDLTAFLANTNPVSLSGQSVNFTDAVVTTVTGDKTFGVGAPNGNSGLRTACSTTEQWRR